MHVKIVFIYTINIQVSKYRFNNKNSFNLILNVANGSFFNSLSKLFHNPTALQGVPKNPKTIEINVLLEFECLSTLLNPHVHQSLT
jgi:hypothetical protein